MSNHQDLVAIFHTSFHPTKGNLIDWCLKISDDVNLTNLEFSTLPSGLHLVESEVIYFTSPVHQDEPSLLHTGVSIFRRRSTTLPGYRGFSLSSIGVLLAISERPRPWRHVPALKDLYASPAFDELGSDLLGLGEDRWREAERWFEERKVRSPDLTGAGIWRGWGNELLDNDDDAPTCHLPHILSILGPSSITLYKHVVGRKRVLIYTKPPRKVESAAMLAFVASELGDGWETESDDDLEPSPRAGSTTEAPVENLINLESTSVPPQKSTRSPSPIPVLGLVTLNDMDRLSNTSHTGWVACTTEAIFFDKPSLYDLLVDLTSPGLRPTLYATRPVETAGGKMEWRRSVIRFAWSDLKLWTEVYRLLSLTGVAHAHLTSRSSSCCGGDPRTHTHPPSSLSSPSSPWALYWADMLRMYEDVCVMCAGLLMWRGPSPQAPSPRAGSAETSLAGLAELDMAADEDATGAGAVRSVGLGIEGGPSARVLTTKAMRRSGVMSWKGRKDRVRDRDRDRDQTPSQAACSSSFPPCPPSPSSQDARERETMATLALLQTFHSHTAWQATRARALLAGASPESADVAQLTPRDVLALELGPFSSLDARYLEWLAERWGDGRRVSVKRGWRELMAMIFGG